MQSFAFSLMSLGTWSVVDDVVATATDLVRIGVHAVVGGALSLAQGGTSGRVSLPLVRARRRPSAWRRQPRWETCAANKASWRARRSLGLWAARRPCSREGSSPTAPSPRHSAICLIPRNAVGAMGRVRQGGLFPSHGFLPSSGLPPIIFRRSIQYGPKPYSVNWIVLKARSGRSRFPD
jgi:hypothetical protein